MYEIARGRRCLAVYSIWMFCVLLRSLIFRLYNRDVSGPLSGVYIEVIRDYRDYREFGETSSRSTYHGGAYIQA